MADYFDSDEITKGYDSRIARRILSYLKPYKAAVALTLLTLVVSTAGELFLPIIVRRVVDEALMVSWSAVDPAAAAMPGGAALKIGPADPVIAGRAYLKASRLSALTGAERKALEAAGLLDPIPRYLLKLDPGDGEMIKAVSGNASLFEAEGGWASIAVAELRRLSPAEARAIRRVDAAFIASNAALLLAALAAVLAATFVQIFAASLIGQWIMKDLRMELFKKTSTRPLAFLSRQPVGRLVTRMTSDVETINQFFTDVVAAFIKDASLMAGVLAVLFALDTRLALVTVATLPPVAILSAVQRVRARDAFRRQRQWVSRVNSYIAERIAGISIVKLFVREEASRKEFGAHNSELMRASLGEMYVIATFRPLIDFLATISTAVILYYGASLLDIKLLSLGTLMAYLNLIRMFYDPVKDIAEKYTLLQSAMAGGERVFRLLDAEERTPDEPRAAMPIALRGHIEFKNVWFAYKEGEWVLKDLSFRVDPGKMVALVGYTGAGKTTVANLITRLWDVQRGEILVDGIPVRDFPLSGLRRAIQPVLQDVFLFSGSIEENIRLGTEVSEERMCRAAEAVHADEFIDRLPEGYKAVLSEGATNISQGQRQILSFARVLAHDPAVIILDEATSSVDTETERMIQRGLEALLAGRTSLVIAHRLSTIRHADRIVVLAQGRVGEEGSHEELLAKQGLYWNLYRLQYGGDVNAQ